MTDPEWQALIEAQRANFQLAFDMQVTYETELEKALATFGIDVHAPNWHDKLPKPPVVTPPPVVLRTAIGACPIGSSLVQVRTKWGNVAPRWYDDGVGVARIPVPIVGTPPGHASWKVLTTGLTDAGFLAATSHLPSGWFIEVEHESDVKFMKARNATELARRLELKAQFHDQKNRLRPDLFTVATQAIWRFRPGNITDLPDRFDAPADYLGVDFDGVVNMPDWAPFIPNVLDFADAHHGGLWTCPEYGFVQQPGRLAHLKQQTPIILAAKPAQLLYWDHDWGTNGTAALESAEDVAFWQSVIAANA